MLRLYQDHYDAWKTLKKKKKDFVLQTWLCFTNVSGEIYESPGMPLQCWKKFNFKVMLLPYKAGQWETTTQSLRTEKGLTW